MSEKDIKTKPQSTTKSVKNAPKSVEHSAKTAVKDIKTVAKDTLVKNVIDKQADARKKYVSEKLKTRAETEKAVKENMNLPKQSVETIKSANADDTAYSSKSMPKTKESYIRSQTKNTADLVRTPDRTKVVPKQNTHTVTRKVSSNSKKAVKTKESFSKGTNAVKTGNSYVAKTARKKSVKKAKRAAKTQKEISKRRQNKPPSRQNKSLKKPHKPQRLPQKRRLKYRLK